MTSEVSHEALKTVADWFRRVQQKIETLWERDEQLPLRK